MARRLRQLGIVFHRLGRAEESTARLREAAALYEKTLGETHADTKINDQTHTVDVTLMFKYGAPTVKRKDARPF